MLTCLFAKNRAFINVTTKSSEMMMPSGRSHGWSKQCIFHIFQIQQIVFIAEINYKINKYLEIQFRGKYIRLSNKTVHKSWNKLLSIYNFHFQFYLKNLLFTQLYQLSCLMVYPRNRLALEAQSIVDLPLIKIK